MKIPPAVVIGLVAAGMAGPAQAAPPPVGSCLNYTADQWVQTGFSATTFDCATPHNGEVMGTVQVPAEIAAKGYFSGAVKAWSFRACQGIAVSYVWTKPKPKFPRASYTLPRSARLNVQLPVPDLWNAGERWVTCLGQSRNVKLSSAQARTGSVRGAGLKPYVCLNPRGWRGTKCTKHDAVRLTNQVWIPDSYTTSYPGTKRMLKKTQKACMKLKKPRKRYSLRTWYVPGLAAWERGNRYGFCEIVK